MLYAVSLDILYTSARGGRVGVERWRGRRWTSRNNGYVLLLRPTEARRGLAPFVQSLGSQSTEKMPAMATIRMMASVRLRQALAATRDGCRLRAEAWTDMRTHLVGSECQTPECGGLYKGRRGEGNSAKGLDAGSCYGALASGARFNQVL